MTPSRQPLADIGVYGLGHLGEALATNLGRNGFRVAVCNIDPQVTERFLANHGNDGEFVGTEDFEDFVSSLSTPRILVLAVKAGPPTTSVIAHLKPFLESGDVLVDSANSKFKDTMRRRTELEEIGVEMLALGVGGGARGAVNGPALMVGGSLSGYELAGPYLQAISMRDEDGEPVCERFGPAGSAHFIKLVHNGIEHSHIQLISEAVSVLSALGVSASEQRKYLREWAHIFGGSFLLDSADKVLAEKDFLTGKPFVEVVRDVMFVSGTDNNVAGTVLRIEAPTTVAGTSSQIQHLSNRERTRKAVGNRFGMERPDLQLPDFDLAKDLGLVLKAACAVSLSQGFDLVEQSSGAYGWGVDPVKVARVWSHGCLIRSGLLDLSEAAYRADSELVNLLVDPSFAAFMEEAVSPWKRLISEAIAAGLVLPALTAALVYFESLRAERLPVAMAQSLRDCLWDDCYQRVDRLGRFHRTWNEPEIREVESKI